MASPKGRILSLLGGLVLREHPISSVTTLSPRFRLIRLGPPDPRPGPGDKLQLLLPGDDVRTYTPFVDGDRVALLAWLHGRGPGSRWAATVAPGGNLRFVGPQRSLNLPDGPVTLVGDETSLGVALAYQRSRSGVTALIETEAPDEVAAVGVALGGRFTTFARGDHAAIASAARAAGRPVGLTGGGALVTGVRRALDGAVTVKPKAYWVEGRAGLD